MTEQMEVWYLASTKGGSHSFTSQVDQAMVDQYGVPIVAPGTLRKILDKRKEQHARELDNLWEHLLDLMEVMYIAREKWEEQADGAVGSTEFDEWQEAKHRVQATIEALAILEYGYLWAEDKKAGTKKAVEKIAQTAKVKYEQSAEG